MTTHPDRLRSRVPVSENKNIFLSFERNPITGILSKERTVVRPKNLIVRVFH